ncbi:hypothetical protein FQN60_001338, partial [Etheostoma spectabile]
MDGPWRQDSLGVSSSVAEGVLTPAALHLRVSAEVERQKEEGRWRGKRAKMSQTSFQSGDRKPSSTAMPTHIFTATKYYPDRGALVNCVSSSVKAQLRVHPADSACEQGFIIVIGDAGSIDACEESASHQKRISGGLELPGLEGEQVGLSGALCQSDRELQASSPQGFRASPEPNSSSCFGDCPPGGHGALLITISNMQARGQTQNVTLPITAPEPGQEPGHRATLQPGRG